MVEAGKNPKALDRRPNVPMYLKFYVDSFWMLSSRRLCSEGVMLPISLQDIRNYLEIYSWHDNDEFVRYVLIMDLTYLGKIND